MSTEAQNIQAEDLQAPSMEQTVESPAATNQSGTFLDSINDDFKAHVEAKGFKDVNDVVKSYVNLEKLVGNSVRVPNNESSPEAIQDFYAKIKDVPGILLENNKDELYTKLGRPESADKYTLEELVKADIAQALPQVHDELQQFKQVAFELGLNNEQATKLAQLELGKREVELQNWTAKYEAGQEALRKHWGADYENRLQGAKQTAKIYAKEHPEAIQELLTGPAGNNPALLAMLSDLALSYKEKGAPEMTQSNFGMTPQQAQAKIAEKRADRGFMKAYHDDMNPNHKAAVEEMTRLYSLLG